MSGDMQDSNHDQVSTATDCSNGLPRESQADATPVGADVQAACQSQFKGAASVPRLGVAHILAWTFCSSVYLAVIRLVHKGPQISGEVTSNTTILLQAIAAGACFTGVAVLVRGRLRGCEELFRSPGHWLTFALALSAFLLVPLTAMFAGQIGINGLAILAIEVYLMSPALVYLFASIFCRGICWRILFLALTIMLGLQGTSFLLMLRNGGPYADWSERIYSLTIHAGLYSVIPMLVLVAFDRIRGVRRDWLHTLGIAVYTLQQASMLIRVIA